MMMIMEIDKMIMEIDRKLENIMFMRDHGLKN